MMKYLAILAIFLVVGCIGAGPTGHSVLTIRPADDTVGAGDLITVDYVGALGDGTKFDSGSLEIIVGSGQVIAGFDDALVGMNLRESKKITILPEQGYGEYDQTKLINIPSGQLIDNGIIPVEGMTVIIGGRSGIIKKIVDGTVLIDLNHPLAGKTLVFDLKITKIR